MFHLRDLHPVRTQLASSSDQYLLREVFGDLAKGLLSHPSEPVPELAALFGLDKAVEGHIEIAVQHKAMACVELIARAMASAMRRDSVTEFSQPSLVAQYLQLRLGDRSAETFAVLWLDSQHRLISYEEMFHGTLTQTSVYPREVVRRALLCNAAAVIFAHNHPSGACQPSRADEALTRILKSALALIDCQVLDHFIVAGTQTSSMASLGLV